MDCPVTTFTFQTRWKEELVCTGPGGAFILDFTMGVEAAWLPTEEVWKQEAPEWAKALWSTLRTELEQWCAAHKCEFHISPQKGGVWSE